MTDSRGGFCRCSCTADPTSHLSTTSRWRLLTHLLHNLPINARQMHVMLLCAELADLSGSGSAQAMR